MLLGGSWLSISDSSFIEYRIEFAVVFPQHPFGSQLGSGSPPPGTIPSGHTFSYQRSFESEPEGQFIPEFDSLEGQPECVRIHVDEFSTVGFPVICGKNWHFLLQEFCERWKTAGHI